jgi:hypothetical protein
MEAQIEVQINVNTHNLNVNSTKVTINVSDSIPFETIDYILADTFDQLARKLYEKINKKINQ